MSSIKGNVGNELLSRIMAKRNMMHWQLIQYAVRMKHTTEYMISTNYYAAIHATGITRDIYL